MRTRDRYLSGNYKDVKSTSTIPHGLHITMTGTRGIYVDPDTDEIKLEIIRDTDRELIVNDKNWLNRYCEDLKTRVHFM
jgi:hypothetical protein